jgi:ankyrin repeat protein
MGTARGLRLSCSGERRHFGGSWLRVGARGDEWRLGLRAVRACWLCRWTALHLASLSGDTETSKALVAAGADVHAADAQGCTALQRAAARRCAPGDDCWARCPAEGAPPGCVAAAAVVWLLLDAGADVAGAAGVKALDCAASTPDGCVAVVRALLDAGAPVNPADPADWRPLRSAISQLAAAVPALLAAGADVNAADADGLTALHCAAFAGDCTTMAALLAAGAHPDAADAQGGTALHEAAECAREEIAEGGSSRAIAEGVGGEFGGGHGHAKVAA